MRFRRNVVVLLAIANWRAAAVEKIVKVNSGTYAAQKVR